MLFTIIVPVYNVEQYLEECVTSLIMQNYDDYEIILVDDGSTDKSGKMCDDFALQNSRIKVIHQENGGLSRARNTGILNSNGEYLVFVDSDDWIESNSLYGFSEIINKSHPEVIETTLLDEYENETRNPDASFSEYLQEEFTRERAQNWIIRLSRSMWPAPKRICNSEFIKNNSLYFAEGRVQEDIDWTTRLVCIAKTYEGYSKPWYHYRRRREGSISNVYNSKYITDAIELAAEDRKYIKKDVQYTIDLFDKQMIAVYSCINMYKHCQKEDKEIVCTCLEKNAWILEYTPLTKHKIFKFAVKMLGVRRAMNILAKIG